MLLLLYWDSLFGYASIHWNTSAIWFLFYHGCPITWKNMRSVLKFFYINSGSLQRPAAYSCQLRTLCGGCFAGDAHDFKICFWMKILLMRSYITIEENLFKESSFLIWYKIIKKSFWEHIHDRNWNYRILFRLLSSRPLLYIQFSNSGESFLMHFRRNHSSIVFGQQNCLYCLNFQSYVVVPGPRSRSYRIVLRYTTHRTLQSVVSS